MKKQKMLSSKIETIVFCLTALVLIVMGTIFICEGVVGNTLVLNDYVRRIVAKGVNAKLVGYFLILLGLLFINTVVVKIRKMTDKTKHRSKYLN